MRRRLLVGISVPLVLTALLAWQKAGRPWPLAALSAAAAQPPCLVPLTDGNRPVAPPDAPDGKASFTDPTVEIVRPQFVRVAHSVYVGPFARLEAQSLARGICIEEGSNVQDNTLLQANGGAVHVGEAAIVAHGAEIVGDGTSVSIAHHPACPLPDATPDVATGQRPDPNLWPTPEARGRQALANALADAGITNPDCTKIPAFIGFNALSHSHIEDGALLAVASRLARGVVLRAGYSSYPGKSLNTQEEADTPGGDPAQFKVRFVTAGDIVFMHAVLHVNECLARGYTMQYRDEAGAIHPFGGPHSIRGIGIDPGAYHGCAFNASSERPTIGYAEPPPRPRDPALAVSDPNPSKNIRIIGDARLGDIDQMQDRTSIRADEGEPFGFGRGVVSGAGTTFHALEPEEEGDIREIVVEDNVRLGERVVVHGGGRRTRFGGFGDEPTEIHAGSIVGRFAVVFRSDLAFNTRVGEKAVLIGWTNERPGGVITETIIPDRCVKFEDTPAGQCAYFVEW